MINLNHFNEIIFYDSCLNPFGLKFQFWPLWRGGLIPMAVDQNYIPNDLRPLTSSQSRAGRTWRTCWRSTRSSPTPPPTAPPSPGCWPKLYSAQQSHYPPPRPNKIVGKDPFAGRDPVNEAFIMTNGADPSSRMVVEEGLVHQSTERLNQGNQLYSS